MPSKNDQSEALLSFIKEKRSNEIYFEQILKKLEEEIDGVNNSSVHQAYITSLQEVKYKYASEYSNSKQKTENAWPEFEKFVTAFERAITHKINAE